MIWELEMMAKTIQDQCTAFFNANKQCAVFGFYSIGKDMWKWSEFAHSNSIITAAGMRLWSSSSSSLAWDWMEELFSLAPPAI